MFLIFKYLWISGCVFILAMGTSLQFLVSVSISYSIAWLPWLWSGNRWPDGALVASFLDVGMSPLIYCGFPAQMPTLTTQTLNLSPHLLLFLLLGPTWVKGLRERGRDWVSQFLSLTVHVVFWTRASQTCSLSEYGSLVFLSIHTLSTCIRGIFVSISLLCQLPGNAVRNYHELGSLKQQKLIVSHFWRPEFWNQLHQVKTEISPKQNLPLSGGSRGEASFTSCSICGWGVPWVPATCLPSPHPLHLHVSFSSFMSV